MNVGGVHSIFMYWGVHMDVLNWIKIEVHEGREMGGGRKRKGRR